MKYLAIILMILFLTACGEDKTINGRYCATYGYVNKEEMKCPNVQYRIIKGNVIWAIFLSASIIPALYVIGWDLYEPVGAIK